MPEPLHYDENDVADDVALALETLNAATNHDAADVAEALETVADNLRELEH